MCLADFLFGLILCSLYIPPLFVNHFWQREPNSIICRGILIGGQIFELYSQSWYIMTCALLIYVLNGISNLDVNVIYFQQRAAFGFIILLMGFTVCEWMYFFAPKTDYDGLICWSDVPQYTKFLLIFSLIFHFKKKSNPHI